MQYEVGTAYVTNLLRQIENQGGSPGDFLAALGVNGNPLIDNQPLTLDAATYSRLYARAIPLTGDECFNFLGPKRFPSGSFGILCDRLLPARNLAGVLRRASELYNWMLHLQHRNAELKPHQPYTREGGIATVYFINQTTAASPVFVTQRAIASGLASWHSFLCWLVDAPIPLLEVGFQGRCQLDKERYQRLLKAPLVFQQRSTVARIGAQFLEAPVVRDQDDLKNYLRLAPYFLIGARERDCEEDSLSNQVRQHLLHGPEGKLPGIDTTASGIGLSSQDLRNGLEREGASYQALRDQVRTERCLRQLRDPALDLEAIAASQGFDTVSAFASSFCDWAGLSPEQYRQALEPATAAG